MSAALGNGPDCGFEASLSAVTVVWPVIMKMAGQCAKGLWDCGPAGSGPPPSDEGGSPGISGGRIPSKWVGANPARAE